MAFVQQGRSWSYVGHEQHKKVIAVLWRSRLAAVRVHSAFCFGCASGRCVTAAALPLQSVTSVTESLRSTLAPACIELTSPSYCWFALRTRYRHEHLVRDQLLAKGIEPFLPTVTRWSRWKDRKKRIQWPLFEGYCFARFDPSARLSVVSCVGVIEIVSSEKRPAVIPDHEIDGVRRLVASGLAYDPHPFLREGASARVVRGPLSGVVGRLVRKGAKARLVLSVELVQAAVSIDVDAADVCAA
jgi:transcription termination/antitermination protein NusG